MSGREVYRLLSILLQYPKVWWEYDFRDEIEEIEDAEIRVLLRAFLTGMETENLGAACAQYVETFDFRESTSLYLTYHRLKEDRARGQVLIQLKERYREYGFEMEEGELPDYLPVLLEFIAIVPDEEAIEEMIRSFAEPINALREALEEQASPYAYLLASLTRLIALKSSAAPV